MKTESIEVEIENKDHKFTLDLFLEETVLDLKRTIADLYSYKSERDFQTYLGDFHLNPIYDSFTISSLMEKFVIEKVYIKDKISSLNNKFRD